MVLRIRLGATLRRLREARGITAQQAAEAIRGSDSKISRIELGRHAAREIDVSDLLSLYEKGKQQQWDTSTRLDWSQELFEGNPMGMSDETIPIYGSPFWDKSSDRSRRL